MANSIDLTPTWGEWGNIYRSLAESGERHAVKHLASDLARALAAAQALQVVTGTLTDEQNRIVAQTMAAELSKQGH
jgi:hypothetical protein